MDQETLYNMVLNSILSWNPSEDNCAFCWTLFLNSMKVTWCGLQCGENPPSASAVIPIVMLTPLLPVAVVYFQQSFHSILKPRESEY